MKSKKRYTKNDRVLVKSFAGPNVWVVLKSRYIAAKSELKLGVDGWDAQIVQSINSKIKKILGKVIFGIKGLEKFIFMKNTKIKVNIDNDELLADWVLCSNSRYYAGHHKITDTNIFEEKFTTYIFKDLSRMKLLYYIFLIIFNGNLNKSTSVITKNTNEVKLKTFDKSIPIQIDGDNFGSLKDIVIKSSKRKFNLLKAA